MTMMRRWPRLRAANGEEAVRALNAALKTSATSGTGGGTGWFD